MKSWIAGALGMLLAWGSAPAQEPVPEGEEFQVNTYTTSSQFNPVVACDSQGDFIVVWWSFGSSGTDTSDGSVQGQRYNARGTPVGGEFQINTYTTNRQSLPAVAADSAGNFVVVWQSGGSSGMDTSGHSVQARLFDAAGTPVGAEFEVNSYTTSSQRNPAVALDSQGDFVVAWDSYGSYGTDAANLSVQAQRFDANGTPVGGQFQVNTFTTSLQNNAALAVGPAGDFVVTWESYGSYGGPQQRSVQGQRFNASGTPVGGEFQVNSYTSNNQRWPGVAIDSQGNFVVVWQSDGGYGTDTGYSIQAQRYEAAGTPVGGEFQVNSYTTYSQSYPQVDMDSQGNFTAVWTSGGSSGTDTDWLSAQGQFFDASGTPVGGEFQINTYTSNRQDSPTVAVDSAGNFVVVWQSYGSDGTDTSYESVQGQRFSTSIFTDGFESGDTSAWSSTVQ